MARWITVLSTRVAGVVTVGDLSAVCDGCHWAEVAGDLDPLTRLLAGLRSLPQTADVVAFVEGDALELVAAEDVLEMFDCLTPETAAVACASPVTDALKRVAAGDRLAGSVDRDGLLTLQGPQVLRREALDDALLALPAGGPSDPAALLTATGHRVRLFRAALSARREAATEVKDAQRVAR